MSLEEAEWKVDSFDLLKEGIHPQITVEELINCEAVVRHDPLVQKLAKDVGKRVLNAKYERVSDLNQVFSPSKSSVRDGPLDTMTGSQPPNVYSKAFCLPGSRSMIISMLTQWYLLQTSAKMDC